MAGALLFSFFIIIDTQIIMNKVKNSLFWYRYVPWLIRDVTLQVSAEEYIHAAILLYLDIVNLFLHILRILGERKK